MANWKRELDRVSDTPNKQSLIGIFERWSKSELPTPYLAQFERLLGCIVAGGLIPETAAIKACEIYKITQPKFAVDPKEVAMTLITRLISPRRIYQGEWGLCGPAAVAYLTAKNNKTQYAEFVHTLLQNGQGTIQGINCKPSRTVRRLDFAKEYGARGNFAIPQADWVVLAGIQASEEGLDKPSKWGDMTTTQIFESFKAKHYRTVMWVRNQEVATSDASQNMKRCETGRYLRDKEGQDTLQIILGFFDNSDKLMPEWRVILI